VTTRAIVSVRYPTRRLRGAEIGPELRNTIGKSCPAHEERNNRSQRNQGMDRESDGQTHDADHHEQQIEAGRPLDGARLTGSGTLVLQGELALDLIQDPAFLVRQRHDDSLTVNRSVRQRSGSPGW
jgi:hypothetical protein